MCVSQDGEFIASGGSYRYIYVFNAKTKEEVGCYPYHKSAILFMQFNAKGDRLVSTSTDNNVMIVNLENKTKKIIMSKIIFDLFYNFRA